MANLHSLPIKSISQMDREELIQHILKIRNARRAPVKKKSGSKSSVPKKEKSTDDILSMLSPEQAQAILSKVEE